MDNLKNILLKKLVEESAFWSYDITYVNSIQDDILIEKTLIYLDLDEINLLFEIFSFTYVKKIWKERLLSQEPFYHNFNKFFGWFYFNEEV